MTGVGICLDKMIFTLEEREGPRSGWVSRRDRSILRKNRLYECLAGTDEMPNVNTAGPQQAIGAFKKPDSKEKKKKSKQLDSF